jgi:cell pole-organizing protein PopZ
MDDDVIELTEIFHEEDEESGKFSDFNKHKDILGSINDTIEFLNNNANSVQKPIKKSPTINSSINKLKDAVKPKHDIQITSNALEELVINLLRPQIAQWLDEYLPKIVASEVEKAVKLIISENK